MRMVGSGPDPDRKSDQLLNVIPAIGRTLVDTVKHNPIIVKLPKETMNLVYRFWIISTMTVWNGMTLLAITWNHSFARIPMNYSTLYVPVIREFVCKHGPVYPFHSTLLNSLAKLVLNRVLFFYIQVHNTNTDNVYNTERSEKRVFNDLSQAVQYNVFICM